MRVYGKGPIRGPVNFANCYKNKENSEIAAWALIAGAGLYTWQGIFRQLL